LVSVWAGVRAGSKRSQAKRRRTERVSCKSVLHNTALVFVKPHACNPGAVKVVSCFLQERGLEILRQGVVGAADIDECGIIDSHYMSIARVGMAGDVRALALRSNASESFLRGFGVSLEDALAAGEVHSAVTAMKVLGVTPTELLERCFEADSVKLGSGLYCAKLPGPFYVLNGFYARLREKFVATGVTVHWFVVRFDAERLTWSTFRRDVIGATNPTDAVAGSLRAKFRDEWEALGLHSPTNYQDNAVHASAGPLEALRERMIWAREDPCDDPFGVAISSCGLEGLLENPDIVLQDGRQGSAFDLLEDVDSCQAVEMLVPTGGAT